MRKIILTAAVTLFAGAVATAQNTGGQITQQIEVTREYVPEISGARKLYFQPQIGDTITLKPDIHYSITPTPWKSVFGTEPITPVAISTAEYRPERPFYLKVAAGYPLQTALDFYAGVPCDPSRGRFGVYLNHYGQWAENVPYKNTNTPNWSESRLALSGGKTFGKRTLDAELGFDTRYYSPNFSLVSGDVILSAAYIGPDLKVTFGDSFTDFSHFNYRAGLKGGYEINYYNSNLGAFADFGWGLKKGTIVAGVEFDSWFMDGYNDWVVGLKPEYRLGVKSFSLEAGVKLFYNNYNIYSGYRNDNKGDKFSVIPKVKLQYDFLSELSVYAGVDGEMNSGGVNALNRINPFVLDYVVNRSVLYDVRGGAKGSAAEMVSYDLFVGYKSGDIPVFVSSEEIFRPYLADFGWFYTGADVLVKLPFGLSVELGGQYNNINAEANIFYREAWNDLSEGVKKVGTGIPAFKIGGKVAYNYRNKLFLKLGLEYAGVRQFTAEDGGIVEKLPATLNLTVAAEYIIKKRFAVFATGDNLLNSEIYRFMGYRALGANVMAGVRLSF